uniref:U6 snRNA-associated Sm-like protein LSm3 n=1 Tax=Saimiri boliviensis boliviensis TaxID=39432 RepID=A0A2K6T9X2_SAIBB
MADDIEQQQTTNAGEEPMDLTRRSLHERIYDQHLNMILGDVEETVTAIEINEETYREIYKSTERNIPMLLVWRDGVILVAPPLRVG